MTSTSGTSATTVAAPSRPRMTRSVRRRRALTVRAAAHARHRRRRGGRRRGLGRGAARWPRSRARTTSRARDGVDDQRQHEQHEARREQGRAVQRPVRRLAELVGDHGRERVALVEELLADLRRVADDERHRDRLADRAAEAEHRGAGDARRASRAAPPCGSSPSASRRARAPPPCARPARVEIDLARDRADDRQDHDREDQPGDEVAGARDRRRRRTAGTRTCRRTTARPAAGSGPGRRSPTARRRPTARPPAARRGSSAGARRRRGHSSVTNSAVATATGTPMISAMAEVISVPTTSGQRRRTVRRDTSQSLPKMKPKTPNCREGVGCASRAGG